MGPAKGKWTMSNVLDMAPERMWTLTDDRGSVRLHLPPLRVADMPKPLRISLDFDAEMVDEVLQRLTVLRSQMLSAPSRN